MLLEEIDMRHMTWHKEAKTLITEASALRWPCNFYEWTNEPIVVSHHTGKSKMFHFKCYIEHAHDIVGTLYTNDATGIKLKVFND